MASNKFPSSEAEFLREENERLRAKIERLEAENAALRPVNKNKAVQENMPEEERAQKRQRTVHHGENSEELCHENGRRAVGADQVQKQQQVIVNNILNLPKELLGRSLDFLEFSERRDFFTCGNRELWEERVRVEYETQIMCDLILGRAPRLGFLGHDFTSVCSLNFGRRCSDAALAVLCHERALPQLKHLAMVGSMNVTDQGLSLLTENPHRRKNLLTLDITFCNRTTFEVTFLLRDLLVNLRILRRRPEWMVGQALSRSGNRFICWPDGISVRYGPSGDLIQCFYLRKLFEEGSRHHVVCKKQVVLSPAFDDWWPSEPEWTRHAYRPGMTLLYVPDTQSILEARPAVGTFAVQGFLHLEDAQWILMNRGHSFNRQGKECRSNDSNVYATVGHSCLQPLDTSMPPQDVVNLCRTQVERAKVVMSGRRHRADESKVHYLLGGSRNDVPPAYWFQHD